jgi:hypothetical protein
MARWRLSCDACGAGAWIGPRGAAIDAWCEACQRGATVPREAPPPRCACGAKLTLGAPRFVELSSTLQHLDAVLAAWLEDAAPLGAILPERPRFLTDLTPPDAAPGDDAATRDALGALRAGAWRRALTSLSALRAAGGATGRVARAVGIAAERTRDLALAERAYDRALAAEDDPATRLARGALRATRADFAGARDDFAHAGDRREVRWNRAALAIVEAVAVTPGLPAAAVIAAAREEAGPPSEYWSDATVGRLLWSLLVERARSRAPRDGAACVDARVLRAAEGELEHETFWDRALVAHGYAALGMKDEAGRASAPLARERLSRLMEEPFARGTTLGPALRAIASALDAGGPAAARVAVTALARRAEVSRYRLPCARCESGAIGVDEVVEDETGSG